MINATTRFLEAMESWVKAARADDFATARVHAERMVHAGQSMVDHPDFVRCFKRHYPHVEPIDGLLHLCQLLVCATEGRARVLKNWVEENRPIDSLNEP